VAGDIEVLTYWRRHAPERSDAILGGGPSGALMAVNVAAGVVAARMLAMA